MPSNRAVEEIKSRLSVIDIISPQVALRKTGQNFKGLCPFHNEKTPSFVVFPDTNSYYCFGCGAKGDVFSYVMQTQKLDFAETLRLLADRAGVTLESRESTAAATAEQQARERLWELNSRVAGVFQSWLFAPAGREALAYTQKRGLTRETLEMFRIGCAPAGWDNLLTYLRGQGLEPADLFEAGLLVERSGGGYYDRFRARLIFPICDYDSHVIGFGGRSLDGTDPKYLNSPETPVFSKGNMLFALDLAKRAIRDAGQAIVVEGYLDAVVAHQAGYRNVVASLGTALTPAQVNLIKRLTTNVALALDPDAAGMEATLRGVDVARKAFDRVPQQVSTWRGIRTEYKLAADIRVIALPAGRDPDEVILESPARWEQAVAEARPVVDYMFEQAVRGRDLSSARDKSALVEQLVPVLVEMSDRVQQAHYVQKLASLVRVDQGVVVSMLRRAARGSGWAPLAGESASSDDPAVGIEEYAVGLLLHSPIALPDMPQLDGAALTRPDLAAIVDKLRALGEQGDFLLEGFFLSLDEELQPVARRCYAEVLKRLELTHEDAGVERRRSVLALRRRAVLREWKQVEGLLKETAVADSPADAQQLIRRRQELWVEQRNLDLALAELSPRSNQARRQQ